MFLLWIPDSGFRIPDSGFWVSVTWQYRRDRRRRAIVGSAGLKAAPAADVNFVGGVVIAAVFITSVALGVATAIAVIAQEVPQEVVNN